MRSVDFLSLQDTLRLDGHVYVVDSYIEGATDFIWGNGVAFFDRCEIKTVGRRGYTVQARNPAASFGYVFVNSRLTSDPGIVGHYLARTNSQDVAPPATWPTSIVDGNHIAPAGWLTYATNTTCRTFASGRAGQPIWPAYRSNPARGSRRRNKKPASPDGVAVGSNRSTTPTLPACVTRRSCWRRGPRSVRGPSTGAPPVGMPARRLKPPDSVAPLRRHQSAAAAVAGRCRCGHVATGAIGHRPLSAKHPVLCATLVGPTRIGDAFLDGGVRAPITSFPQRRRGPPHGELPDAITERLAVLGAAALFWSRRARGHEPGWSRGGSRRHRPDAGAGRTPVLAPAEGSAPRERRHCRERRHGGSRIGGGRVGTGGSVAGGREGEEVPVLPAARPPAAAVCPARGDRGRRRRHLDQTATRYGLLTTYTTWLSTAATDAASWPSDKSWPQHYPWQMPHGGFYKNEPVVYSAPWNGTDARSGWLGANNVELGTIDNNATVVELMFLADVYRRSAEVKYRDSARKAIDFLLTMQYPSGGFPQVYPARVGATYSNYVTFNDDAMARVLLLLDQVSSNGRLWWRHAHDRTATKVRPRSPGPSTTSSRRKSSRTGSRPLVRTARPSPTSPQAPARTSFRRKAARSRGRDCFLMTQPQTNGDQGRRAGCHRLLQERRHPVANTDTSFVPRETRRHVHPIRPAPADHVVSVLRPRRRRGVLQRSPPDGHPSCVGKNTHPRDRARAPRRYQWGGSYGTVLFTYTDRVAIDVGQSSTSGRRARQRDQRDRASPMVASSAGEATSPGHPSRA